MKGGMSKMNSIGIKQMSDRKTVQAANLMMTPQKSSKMDQRLTFQTGRSSMNATEKKSQLAPQLN